MKSTFFALIIAAFLVVGITAPALAATIQEQARATRESFIRLQNNQTSDEPEENSDSSVRFQTLEKRIADLKEQAILISYNRVIGRLQHYAAYLENITKRLETRLSEESATDEDLEATRAQISSASALIASASSTIAVAVAS